jgi:hypothetical protein
MIEGTFVEEPRGLVYRNLIAALAPMADRALLVERTIEVERGRVLGSLRGNGEALRLKLQPWCVAEDMRSGWPGTTLLGSTALVREYTLSDSVVGLLQVSVDGLYEWRGDLPQDLALVRPKGEALMLAISHEREGGLALYPDERARLLSACPGLDACVEWREVRNS